MASITKTKGRWQARVRLKGHELRCKTFDARRDAVTWAQETEMALRKRSPAAEEARRLATTLTLRGVLQRYENEVTPSKRSAERERYMMRNLRAEADLVDKPIGKILPRDISAWLNRRRQSVAEGTALREWCLLQHVFEVARRDWGVAVDNPLKEARRPRGSGAWSLGKKPCCWRHVARGAFPGLCHSSALLSTPPCLRVNFCRSHGEISAPMGNM